MVYIRAKKFKRKNGEVVRYAYLVKNIWKKRGHKGSKKGARQKVRGYLGKVYGFSRVEERDFIEHFSISDTIFFPVNGQIDSFPAVGRNSPHIPVVVEKN